MGEEWEYIIVLHPSEAYLDELVKEGWELIQVRTIRETYEEMDEKTRGKLGLKEWSFWDVVLGLAAFGISDDRKVTKVYDDQIIVYTKTYLKRKKR